MIHEARDVEAEQKERPSIIDWLGPGPVVTIILTVGSALVVTGVSIWNLVGSHASQLALLSERSLDHEQRLREQEFRPPRLAPLVDEIKAKCDGIGERIPAMTEQIKALEGRVVGIGPNGWHRDDHDLYARMIDERNDRVRSRLDIIEKRQDQLCERIRECRPAK